MLRRLLVLTPSSYADIIRFEAAHIKAGLPIKILLDESGLFADSNLSGAPEFICVNNKSTVIWDNSLYDDYDYWTMLSKQT